MGHQHLGVLPRSRRWQTVIALIGGGAGVQAVAAATAVAAESKLFDASNDVAVRRAVWLLTQIPIAARAEDFGKELRKLGLPVGEATKSGKHCGVCTQCIDRRFGVLAADLGEYEPPRHYESDLLRGEHNPGVERTLPIEKFRFMKTSSISDALGITGQTIRQHVFRFRQTIAKQFRLRLDRELDDDDVIENIEGKGYRLNPHLVLVSLQRLNSATPAVSQVSKPSVTTGGADH
jgi:hypothetical protein